MAKYGLKIYFYGPKNSEIWSLKKNGLKTVKYAL